MNDNVNETTENTTATTTEDNNAAVKLEDFQTTSEDELLGAVEGEVSDEAGLEAMYGIPITVSAVLGETKMPIKQLLKLGRGAVVELDRKVGEAIDIYVNNRLIARGEVVIVDDKLGVTMTEIVKSEKSQ